MVPGLGCSNAIPGWPVGHLSRAPDVFGHQHRTMARVGDRPALNDLGGADAEAGALVLPRRDAGWRARNEMLRWGTG